ncbi:hypothetical protein GWI34_03320 [Actinomadura sp. DSM 109109]|nr:hypothetical protein [Actinomadura lepetitiana]
MIIRNGVIGNHPEQPAAFEKDGVPYPIAPQRVEICEPTDALIEHAVQGIYADLPPEVRTIVALVARELFRNAQAYGQAPTYLLQSGGGAVTLTLGWATDERDYVKYPLITVRDQNPELPEVQESPRTGLGRVISLTHRCGATNGRGGGGKHVWALVDPQRR